MNSPDFYSFSAQRCSCSKGASITADTFYQPIRNADSYPTLCGEGREKSGRLDFKAPVWCTRTAGAEHEHRWQRPIFYWRDSSHLRAHAPERKTQAWANY
ncbi:MAG: hypothetical protein EA381_15015 [Planctomycetaceae bacterium]|nr:MAG: hypothetical protein EA381_15015 [Planctomycetaceae bacterium]